MDFNAQRFINLVIFFQTIYYFPANVGQSHRIPHGKCNDEKLDCLFEFFFSVFDKRLRQSMSMSLRDLVLDWIWTRNEMECFVESMTISITIPFFACKEIKNCYVKSVYFEHTIIKIVLGIVENTQDLLFTICRKKM